MMVKCKNLFPLFLHICFARVKVVFAFIGTAKNVNWRKISIRVDFIIEKGYNKYAMVISKKQKGLPLRRLHCTVKI